MNETVGDLMAQYQAVREGARCHSSWENLDKFVLELVKRVAIAPNQLEHYKVSDFAPPVITPPEQPMRKFQEYSFDADGAPIE